MNRMGLLLVLLLVRVPSAPAQLNAQAEANGVRATPAPEATPDLGHREEPLDAPEPAPRGPVTSRAAVVERDGFVSVQVNVNANGDNILHDAANEPSLAVDPTNPARMAIGWRQFDSVLSNFRQAGWSYSTDGGTTWGRGGRLQPGVFRSDPVLAANSAGVFYYNSLTSDFRCQVFRSTDGGQTWLGPAEAFGGDKAWMTVDATTGPGRGFLYQAWSPAAGCCGPRIFNRSTDGGQTWSDPIALSRAPRWGTLAVGPDGELYVVGGNGGSAVIVLKSTNAQLAGAAPTFSVMADANIGGIIGRFGLGPNPGGLLGQAWVDVDRSDGPRRGWVYVASSMAPSGGGDPLDVGFARSRDGGLTWDPPVRINDDPVGNGAWQWFGTMAVAPNGRIDVAWNDTRETPGTHWSAVYYSYSLDGGASWSPNVALTPVFDPSLGYPNQSKLGDYYHMVSHDTAAYLAYAATFNGEQDVYLVRIPADCNGNGVPDPQDIASGASTDCDGDGTPDDCQPDCDADGLADVCALRLDHDCCDDAHGPGCSDADIAACICAADPYCCTTWWDRVCAARVREGSCGRCRSEDCESNGIPDECEPPLDCNANGVRDACDIAAGTSADCDGAGVPDECQPFIDCNANGAADFCDLAAGESRDCTGNGIPDECDLAAGREQDCQPNGIPDRCDTAEVTNDCCRVHLAAGCTDFSITACVCAVDPYCCSTTWDALCVAQVNGQDCGVCPASADCDDDDVPDECNLAQEHDCCGFPHAAGCSDAAIEACVCAEDDYCCANEWDRACAELVAELDCGICPADDCDANGRLDECDLALGALDCNSNARPDDCDELDLVNALVASPSPTVCFGDPVTFTVAAPNDATSFQWRRDGVPLADGNGLSGAATPALAIDAAGLADEGVYACAVSVGCITVTSQPAELTVIPAQLAIAQQPVVQVVRCGADGQGAVFVCKPDDATQVQYQWQRDGVPLAAGSRILGVDTERLEIREVTPADAGVYQCTVTNACGGAALSSPDRGALVVADPAFVQLPASACVEPDGSVVFAAEAIGPLPLSYAWYRDGQQVVNGPAVSGAFSSTLTLHQVPASYEGSAIQALAFTLDPVCIVESPAAALLVDDCPPCPLPGDADGDGDVDLFDFARLSDCFGGAGGAADCACVDTASGDNLVDLADLARFEQLLTGPRRPAEE